MGQRGRIIQCKSIRRENIGLVSFLDCVSISHSHNPRKPDMSGPLHFQYMLDLMLQLVNHRYFKFLIRIVEEEIPTQVSMRQHE